MDHVTPERLNDYFLDKHRAFGIVASIVAHLREVCPPCGQGYDRWMTRRLELGLPFDLVAIFTTAPPDGSFDPPEDEALPPAEDHLTPVLLDQLPHPPALGGVYVRLLTHLLEHCPTCEAGYLAWQQLRAPASIPPPPTTYVEAIERVTDSAQRAGFRVAEERATATMRLEELLALPHRERLAAIHVDPDRFSGPALAERLIAESRDRMPGRPRESLDLACLAAAVLRHSDRSLHAIDLYVLATARIANATRVHGRLTEAAEMFGAARYLLDVAGSTDVLLGAELDDLEGSLLRDQRRFEEAETTLRRAEAIYRFEGHPIATARVLMKLDSVYFEQGDLPRAIRAARQAIALLDPEEDARLHFYARHNLAHDLCDAGEFAEARSLLMENRRLAERHCDEISQLRIAHVEGKVARGFDDPATAESLLLTARHGFLRRAILYDAALVSLELAILYLEQSRTAEVRELAMEMAEVFEREQVHREATAALILFRDAAKLERASVALVREFAVYLRRAQRDPSYAFQDAS